MITPLPIVMQEEQERCPKCEKLELKKTICVHCGYEYRNDDNFGIREFILTTILVFLICYILITILWWMMEGVTLVDVFKSQIQWVRDLFGRIY